MMLKDFIKVLLAVLAVTLIRQSLGLSNFHAGIDDSNIYFVYVKNLYEGNGFVYNFDGPRVEGFTSFLWTLVLALIYSIRILPFETSILVLCFFITTLTVYQFFRFVKNLFSESLGLFIVAYMVLMPGFIDWNVFTLMDLCLWILAGSWAILLLLNGKNPRTFFVLTVLLPFIRPEGMALSFILVFLRMVKDYAVNLPVKDILKKNAGLLLAVIGSVALLTAFRLAYFGYPFPNTFYAKVSMSLADNIRMAAFYLYDAVRHTSFIPFLLLAFTLGYLLFRKYWASWRSHINILVLVLIILFFIGYPFLTGGDHFKYSRFFQPVFPLTGLLFLLIFGKWMGAGRPAMIIAGLIILVLANLNSTDDSSFRNNLSWAFTGYFRGLRPDLVSSSQLQSEFDIGENGRKLAGHMNLVTSTCDSLPSYGVIAAGGIGYVYEGQTIDLMGLNNPAMAHADKIKSKGVKNHGSFNKKVFYEQDVDIFLTWPDPLTDKMQQDDQSALLFLERLQDSTYFINRICGNIFNDADFRSRYQFSKISNGKDYLYGFVKQADFGRKYPCLQVHSPGN